MAQFKVIDRGVLSLDPTGLDELASIQTDVWVATSNGYRKAARGTSWQDVLDWCAENGRTPYLVSQRMHADTVGYCTYIVRA